MKKVLFATTALVATAGFASADVTISGFAEMGIDGGTYLTTGGAKETLDPTFHNDFTVTIDGSGSTDNGLTFGFHAELEESNTTLAVNGPTSWDNESVFISGAFGTLTMGEIDGAYDKALSEVNLAGGSINDAETTHAGFNGMGGFDGSYDNQILRYDYSFGDLTVSASVEQAANGQKDGNVFGLPVGGAKGDDNIGIGVSYSMDMSGVGLDLGLGYQHGSALDPALVATNGDIIGASVIADFANGFKAGINYQNANWDNNDVNGAASPFPDSDTWGVGVAYTMDALTLAANYGAVSNDGANNDADGYGLVANYDLGGGAVVQFGYGHSNVDGVPDTDSYSLGLAMSF